jgi:hypothetical protein
MRKKFTWTPLSAARSCSSARKHDMNKKKLVLFLSGAVAATGAFLLYQALTGSEWSNKPVVAPTRPTTIAYSSGFRLEIKDASIGDSLITADKFIPLGTDGKYQVTKFCVEWAMGNNQKIVLEADQGTVESELDGKKQPQKFKKFNLSGNITVTFGPNDSFESSSTKPATASSTAATRPLARKPNQLQVKFQDKSGAPAQLAYDDKSKFLTSDDAVAITSDQVTFSGKGLLLHINQPDKRIELLRIAQGEKIKIVPDENGDIKFGFAGSPAEPDPLKFPATTQAAATKPKKKPTQYLLDFSENIKITHGDLDFNSHQLQLSVFDDAKEFKTKSTATPDKKADAKAKDKDLEWDPKLETNITWTGPLVVRPAGQPEDFQLKNPKDIHIAVFGGENKPVDAKWGERRLVAQRAVFDVLPAEDGLKSNAEVILDAVGTASTPVSIQDGKSFARGGHIRFKRNTREGIIEKGDYKEAEVQYFENGQLAFAANHPQIIVGKNLSTIDLDGPGRATFAAEMFNTLGDSKPAADAKVAKELTDITFSEGLHVVADLIENAREPSKPHVIWKSVKIAGASTVANPALHLTAGKSIDVSVAVTITKKAEDVFTFRHELDKITAAGGVLAKFARPNLTLSEKDSPDSVESDSIEVLTKQIAGTRQIDEIRFKRENAPVVALLHQMSGDKNERGEKVEPRLLTQRVEAPAITALLNPKIKSTTAPATAKTANDFGVNIREIIATGGVKATIEGFSEMVGDKDEKLIVTAGEFKAFPGAGNTSTIELTGQKTVIGVTPVKLAVGKNFIEGKNIKLDQGAQSIFIPGEGRFHFVDEADKTKPVPYAMRWADRDLGGGKIEQSSMTFDQKKLQAVIKGDVAASSEGKPGEKSLLKANAITVDLLSSAERKSQTQPGDRFGLKSFVAEGNVVALGETHDPGANNLLTKQEIKSQKLTFNNATRIAQSPGAGEILIMDLRPPEKAATQPAAALGGANMRGGAWITWKGTLTYNGDAGAIDLNDTVELRFLPTENSKTGTSVNSSAMTKLTAPHLGVKIETNKTEKKPIAASPAALGNSGSIKVTSFVADGGATLIRGPASMTGDVLSIDPVKNVARADGNVVLSPDQKTFSKMQSWTWDLSKDGNALEIGNTVIKTGG